MDTRDTRNKHKSSELGTDEYLLGGTDNFDFVQVSRAYLKDWRALTKKSPLGSEILMYLIETMGKTTNAVVCSYLTLTEITGVSRTSVARAIKILKEDRWIEAVKIGNATAYAVNASVFWQSKRNQKQYAIFQATVVASSSEQEKGYNKKKPLRHIPFVGEDPVKQRVIVSNEQLPPPDQADLDLD